MASKKCNRTYRKRVKRSVCRGKSRSVCGRTSGCSYAKGKSTSFCRKSRNRRTKRCGR